LKEAIKIGSNAATLNRPYLLLYVVQVCSTLTLGTEGKDDDGAGRANT
jgi:hypothetical protein